MDLLIMQEQLACDFYRRCARMFPDRNGLWRPLIEAEESHVRFLQEIAAMPEAVEGFGRRREFAVNPLRILLGRLRRNIEMLDLGGATLLGALTFARDMEDSVLERRILECLPGDPPGVCERITQMNAETTDHRARVQSALAEAGR